MFVNDLPSVVSSPVYMFADDTKIFRVIRTSEDSSALQHDLDLLYDWSIHWHLKFNILKCRACKHMHLRPIHHYGPYYLNGTVIDSTDSYKDLDIILDHQLKFHLHSTEVTNRLLGVFRKSFDHLDSEMLTKLFTAFVHPPLEYNNAVWGPIFVLDQRSTM